MDNPEPIFYEGRIDLLAINKETGMAFVKDEQGEWQPVSLLDNWQVVFGINKDEMNIEYPPAVSPA